MKYRRKILDFLNPTCGAMRLVMLDLVHRLYIILPELHKSLNSNLCHILHFRCRDSFILTYIFFFGGSGFIGQSVTTQPSLMNVCVLSHMIKFHFYHTSTVFQVRHPLHRSNSIFIIHPWLLSKLVLASISTTLQHFVVAIIDGKGNLALAPMLHFHFITCHQPPNKIDCGCLCTPFVVGDPLEIETLCQLRVTTV